jgi:hypothetical protein
MAHVTAAHATHVHHVEHLLHEGLQDSRIAAGEARHLQGSQRILQGARKQCHVHCLPLYRAAEHRVFCRGRSVLTAAWISKQWWRLCIVAWSTHMATPQGPSAVEAGMNRPTRWSQMRLLVSTPCRIRLGTCCGTEERTGMFWRDAGRCKATGL